MEIEQTVTMGVKEKPSESFDAHQSFHSTLLAQDEMDLEERLISTDNGCDTLTEDALFEIQQSISEQDHSFTYQTQNGSIYIKDKKTATDLLIDMSTQRVYKALAAGYLQALSTDKDFLTNLYRREILYQDLNNINRCFPSDNSKGTGSERRKNARGEYGLIFLDIDHFSKLNNETPAKHAQGDYTLKEVADLIASNVNGKAYRYGGEEFVVLLSDSDEEATRVAAERLRAIIETHDFAYLGSERELTENTFTLTASLGAVHSSTIKDAEQMLGYANAGENLAKQAGRNKVIYGDIEFVNYEMEENHSQLDVQMEFSLTEHAPLREQAYEFMKEVTYELCSQESKGISTLEAFLEKDPIQDGIEDIAYLVRPLIKNNQTCSELQITRGQVSRSTQPAKDSGHLKLQTKPQYFEPIKQMLIEMAAYKGADNNGQATLAKGYELITDHIKNKNENNTMDVYFQFDKGLFTVEIETDSEQFINTTSFDTIPDYAIHIKSPRKIALQTRLYQ
jgi:diguanylate cyclase (GGDEF)-like protein